MKKKTTVMTLRLDEEYRGFLAELAAAYPGLTLRKFVEMQLKIAVKKMRYRSVAPPLPIPSHPAPAPALQSAGAQFNSDAALSELDDIAEGVVPFYISPGKIEA